MATMATLRQVIRTSQIICRRNLATTGWVAEKYRMNDPYDHATGLEKWELQAKKAGKTDPFFMDARKRGKGTKEDPNIVDAMDDFRIMGCVCNENDTNTSWMWIYNGEPKRCACGYWFKLVKHEGPTKETVPL